MADKESLNFYKLSSFLLDVGAEVMIKRIEEVIKQKSVSFEDFLNQLHIKDDLFHLWRPNKCCISHCNTNRKKTVLQKAQWDQLYISSSAPIVGHIQKDSSGRVCQSCLCMYSAIRGVNPGSFDVTLASCLLKTVCNLSSAEKKSIDSLRELRNSVFAHANGSKLSDVDFNHNWQCIESEITSIASHCDMSVKNDTQQKIDRMKALPFIDDTAFQTLISEIKRLHGRETCMFEAFTNSLQDTSDTILQSHSGQFIQRITESELDIEKYDYIQTRALDAGIRSLQENGITIFTGVSGSGKSFNSIQILRKVTEGEVLETPHAVKHISIDQWDLQVDLLADTVIFLEDPLGKTNTNKDLILNDGGRFNKIWASLQKGNIKVIITIRSNIWQENVEFLTEFKIFQQKHIVDLSYGDFSLTQGEKKKLIEFHCRIHGIEIIHNSDDETVQVPQNESTSIRLPIETIHKVININPPIGYPLCCKRFFENRNNMLLDDRFFLQPTKFILDEMKCLALNDDETQRRQFAVLLYILMNDGTIDTQNIDIQKMDGIIQELDLPPMKQIHVRSAIQKLNRKYIFDTDGHSVKFSIFHTTILEAIFIICGGELSGILPLVLMHCNIKTLCEIVRTENMIVRENEIVCKIRNPLFRTLASRFVQEIQKGFLRCVVAYLSLDDESFLSEFVKTLQQIDNKEIIYKGTDDSYSFFHLSCLFDRSLLIHCLLQHQNYIPSYAIFEGCLTCIKFENADTLKAMLMYVSAKQRECVFECACRESKTELINLILDLRTEFNPPIGIERGFITLCEVGNRTATEAVLNTGINKIPEGFTKTCQHGHVSILQLLISIITNENCLHAEKQQILRSGFLISCGAGHEDASIFILQHLTQYDIQEVIVEACNNGMRKILSKIMRSTYVTDKTAKECLIGICESEEELNSKVRSKYDMKYSFDDGCSFSDKRLKSYGAQSVGVCGERQGSYQINLLPGMTFNKPFSGERFWNATQQIKAFLVRSILQIRTHLTVQVVGDVLTRACVLNRSEIVYIILRQRRDLSSAQIKTSLFASCNYNRTPETVKVILENRKDISPDIILACLDMAFKARHNETFKSILEMKPDLSDEQVTKSLVHLWDITENELLSTEDVQSNIDNYISIVKHILCKRSNITCALIMNALPHCISGHRSVLEIVMLYSNLQISQRMSDHFSSHLSHISVKKINEHSRDLTTDQICKFMLNFCKPDRAVCTSFLYFFIKLSGDINTDQGFPLLLELCSTANGNATVVKKALQNKSDLSTEQVYQCFLRLCLNKHIHTSAITTFLQQRQNISADQVYRCLFQLCSHSDIDSCIIKLFSLFNSYVTTEQVYQCLLRMCSNKSVSSNTIAICLREKMDLSTDQVSQCLLKFCSEKRVYSSTTDIFFKQRRNMSTDQFYQCMLQLCSRNGVDASIVTVFLQEKSDLATEQVHQCLLALCSNERSFNLSTINILLQQRRDLSTDQVYNCLFQLCSRNGVDSLIVAIFLQIKSNLSTKQVNQCLLTLCSNGSVNSSTVKFFFTERRDMSTDQIYQCLFQLFSRNRADALIITLFLQEKSNLTAEQTYQCLLRLCSNKSVNSSTIETLLLEQRRDMSTYQIYRCLLQLCSHNAVDALIVKLFLQENSNLSTEEVHQCLLNLCTNESLHSSTIETFLQQRRDMSTDQIYQCLFQVCSWNGANAFIVSQFLQKNSNLTTEEVHQCLLRLFSNKSVNSSSIKTLLLNLTVQVVGNVLTRASTHNRSEIVHMILEQRRNLSPAQIKTSFFASCVNNKTPETVKVILEIRKDISSGVILAGICMAFKARHNETIKSILEMKPDLSDEQVTKSLVHLWDIIENEPISTEDVQRNIDNYISIINHILYKRSNITCALIMNALTEDCISEHRSVLEIVMLYSNLQISQNMSEHFSSHLSDTSVQKIIELSSDLTMDHICQFMIQFCTFDRAVRTSFLYLFIKLNGDINTDQGFPLLLELCSTANGNATVVKKALQNKSDLSTEQVYQCFLRLCLNKFIHTSAITTFLQKRQDISADQVYRCLIQLCSYSDADSCIIKLFLLVNSYVTTEQVYQCLLRTSSNKNVKSSTIKAVFQQRRKMSTYQIYQCLFQLCSRNGVDTEIVTLFLQEKSNLTTEQVHQCLLILCSNKSVHLSTIEIFLQQRRDMSTDQIYQCLLQVCSGNGVDSLIVSIFLQQTSNLTTEQVHQCLLTLCSNESVNSLTIETFLQQRRDMSTHQIYQCLFQLCSRNGFDALIITLLLQGKSNLTTEQLHQCLLRLCSNENVNSWTIETLLLQRWDLSTDQLYQCLLQLCSRNGVDSSTITIFLQEKSNLTTEQVHQCLLILCSNTSVDSLTIETFLRQRRDMSKDQIYQCLLELCSRNGVDALLVTIFQQEKSNLTTEQVHQCLFRLCSNKSVHLSTIETFLHQRHDISTDQMFQYLFQQRRGRIISCQFKGKK